MIGDYAALVRKYHPAGYAAAYYAGCTKRRNGKRMTDICAHQHATHADAQACADKLAALRNSGRGMS